ncbi:MAG: sulfotransferase domain-containing protein [Desulfarculaceae bacterium]|nr:sulfotransferase domain-containing protein [Desulfarculaceae bacterium]
MAAKLSKFRLIDRALPGLSELGYRLLFGAHSQAGPQDRGRLVADYLRRTRDLEVLQRVLAVGNLPKAAAPQLVPAPSGRRLLVLAPHQDDEIIGCGGMLLQAMAQGCAVRVVYLTDGVGARLKGAEARAYGQQRRQEALEVWGDLPAGEPVFLDLPGKAMPLDQAAVRAVGQAVEDFAPDMVLLPFFLEPPEDHRKCARLFCLAARERGLAVPEVWSYQVYGSLAANLAVDISAVAPEKARLMGLWRSQNQVYDWASYAMGLASVNSWQVKNQLPRGQAEPRVELFLSLPLGEYLALAGGFFGGAPQREAYPGPRPEAGGGEQDAAAKLKQRWITAKSQAKMGLRRLEVLARPGEYYAEQGPDFLVVGLQKCGTYWLTNLLMNHPEASCQPTQPEGEDRVKEGHFFDAVGALDSDPEFFRRRMLYKHHGFFADLAQPTLRAGTAGRGAALAKLCRRYNAFVRRNARPGARLVGEKTAEYIFHHQLIGQLYPQTKLVCVMRHPRDRIVSFHHHQIRKGRWDHAEIEDWEVAQYCDRVAWEYACLLECQQALHLITYEELTRRGPETVAGLCRFLGLDASAEVVQKMLDQARFDRLAKKNPGAGNPHQHFRQGKVGEGKQRLSPAQQAMIQERLGELTRRVAERYGLDLGEYLE